MDSYRFTLFLFYFTLEYRDQLTHLLGLNEAFSLSWLLKIFEFSSIAKAVAFHISTL